MSWSTRLPKRTLADYSPLVWVVIVGMVLAVSLYGAGFASCTILSAMRQEITEQTQQIDEALNR